MVVIDTEGNASSSAAPDDDPQSTELTIGPAQIEQDQVAARKCRVAVFVTMTPHADRTAFKRLVDDSAAGFDAAEIISVGSTERIDPREAARLGIAITHRIKRLSVNHRRAEVHLAFHGPYAMAVLIGRYLNTLRTVVYEWDGNMEDGPATSPSSSSNLA